MRLIRAVKYSCAIGAKPSLLLKMQIKKDAHLLENTSPSRLTEEINKIFHSTCVYEVVTLLFEYGLYAYIQPNACIFLYESKRFRKTYFASLEKLNDEVIKGAIKKQSDFLYFIIRDYISLISNIEYKSKKELYTFVYKETRHFILPMNPQRKELEDAVKICLNDLEKMKLKQS